MTLPETFDAFRIHRDDRGHRSGLERLALDALTPGQIVVRADWSSVNYKDALAGTGKGRILRRFPLVGGIDVAGTVVGSTDPAWAEGDAVIATGCGLGESRDGGYSQFVRLESSAAIRLPRSLSPREAMIIGTAGFTAALALLRMLDNRQTPAHGPLVVTGASGGVGSLAIDIFSRAGFEVHAVSGKPDQAAWLQALGATQVLSRDVLADTAPLQSARFGGGLDNVGGPMLASLLAQTTAYGSVVSAGLAASPALDTAVMPFILRGVSLLGVSSSNAPRALREQVWERLGSDWRPARLDAICTREVGMQELPEVFEAMLAGGARGRTVVRID